MNNCIATVDLQTGTESVYLSALDLQRENIGSGLESMIAGTITSAIAKVGIILAIAVSPSTATPDIWFFEKRRRDTATVALVFEGMIGRRISRAEALRIAEKILKEAERKRIEFAEWEASRGIQWGDEL
ncbi:hypothetical protein [Candidatus Electronema sp. PJ]|uniref:hypothetical protein n=1 Tax=Candidatus Electronema sp. PJ TaxID=3401572 RepID=UPI003AA83EEA